MTRPELSRRVERAEEDLTAIFDTVLDIQKTVDRHTEMFAVHTETLAAHTETLAAHTETLAGHTETLVVHGRELAAIRETQAQHGEVLVEILRRLDARRHEIPCAYSRWVPGRRPRPSSFPGRSAPIALARAG
jgi:plasmid stabilization system protein ParE